MNANQQTQGHCSILLIKQCSHCNLPINWHFQVAKYIVYLPYCKRITAKMPDKCKWAQNGTGAITNFCSKVFSFKCFNGGIRRANANTTATQSLSQPFRFAGVFSVGVVSAEAVGVRMQNRFSIATQKTTRNICLFNLFYNHKCLGITWFARFAR